MTFEQIIKKIESGGSIDYRRFEKDFLRELLQELDKSLVVQNGNIVSTTKSSGRIVTDAIKNFYQTSAYKDSIMKLLRNIGTVGDAKMQVYKDTDMIIEKAAITPAQSVVVNEFLDELDSNGLNTRFNQTYRQLIYDSIRTNASQRDLELKLKDMVQSGKSPARMANYIKNVAVQTADAYSSIIDKEIYSEYKDKVTHYRMVGSLIETSSPQCRYVVEQFNREVPIDRLDEVFDVARENGLIDGTTAENLPVNKLHWGCRHQFIPIIKVNKKNK
jgi:hypothetical protein